MRTFIANRRSAREARRLARIQANCDRFVAHIHDVMAGR